MKRFEVDCNFNYLGPDKPALSIGEVIALSLNPDEKVLVFQDEDEWSGIVVFDKSLPQMYQWYVRIIN
jgi:hypothetical protein